MTISPKTIECRGYCGCCTDCLPVSICDEPPGGVVHGNCDDADCDSIEDVCIWDTYFFDEESTKACVSLCPEAYFLDPCPKNGYKAVYSSRLTYSTDFQAGIIPGDCCAKGHPTWKGIQSRSNFVIYCSPPAGCNLAVHIRPWVSAGTLPGNWVGVVTSYSEINFTTMGGVPPFKCGICVDVGIIAGDSKDSLCCLESGASVIQVSVQDWVICSLG